MHVERLSYRDLHCNVVAESALDAGRLSNVYWTGIAGEESAARYDAVVARSVAADGVVDGDGADVADAGGGAEVVSGVHVEDDNRLILGKAERDAPSCAEAYLLHNHVIDADPLAPQDTQRHACNAMSRRYRCWLYQY